MESVAQFIRSLTSPTSVIYFGSVTNNNFDQASDVDVVAVYESVEQAKSARHILYTSPLPKIDRAIEILCVDQVTFDLRSEIGGVYAIAKYEGLAK